MHERVKLLSVHVINQQLIVISDFFVTWQERIIFNFQLKFITCKHLQWNSTTVRMPPLIFIEKFSNVSSSLFAHLGRDWNMLGFGYSPILEFVF